MSGLGNLPPGSQPDTDVVTKKVFVGTTEVSDEISLASITINKTFNKVASAKLIFLDGSVAERDFPLSNDDQFKPGNDIKVQLGYHGEVETVFEGIIIKHAVKVKQNGDSQLIIEAKDTAIKLTGARKSAYFLDTKDSDVFTTMAGELQKDIDPTNVIHKQLVQYNTTDWDFILIRAEANGMLVFTDDGKIIIKKPTSDGEPDCAITYGDNIWEFEAETDVRNHKKQITSQSWDYTHQQVMPSNPTSVTFADTGNFANEEMANVLGAEVNLIHTGNLTTEQLDEWSNAYALRNHLSHAIGRVRIEGRASIKPGSIITLDGVGDRFNGNVFVTGVLHHYQGLWQTDIQFGWREEWFYKKDDVMDKPGAGLLPGINGLQIGIVKSVDDSQEQQYRVKVHTPMISSSNEGIWARVSTLDAGANRGVYFRPQEGDEVILGFLNDDPREPIVLGYLHSKESKASPLPEQSGAEQYGIVTKEGNQLIFDDSNKIIKLRIVAGQGEKTLIMDGSGGTFEMKDENSNSIKMDSQGITIQAGTGMNVTIAGTTVAIN